MPSIHSPQSRSAFEAQYALPIFERALAIALTIVIPLFFCNQAVAEEKAEVAQQDSKKSAAREQRDLISSLPNPYPIDSKWMERGGYIDDLKIKNALSYRGYQLWQEEKHPSSLRMLEEFLKTKNYNPPKLPTKAGISTPEKNYASTVILADLDKLNEDDVNVENASGVLISSDGLILTNLHCVIGGNRLLMFAVTTEGQVLPVTRIIAASISNDLAILKVDGKDLPYSPIGITNPNLLSEVYSIGHPFQAFYTSSKGVVTRYRTAQAAVPEYNPNGITPAMQISSSFGLGSSGGPVFNSAGQIVGLTTSQQTGKNPGSPVKQTFYNCIPVREIRDLLAKGTDEKTVALLKKKCATMKSSDLASNIFEIGGVSSEQAHEIVRISQSGKDKNTINAALKEAGISVESFELITSMFHIYHTFKGRGVPYEQIKAIIAEMMRICKLEKDQDIDKSALHAVLEQAGISKKEFHSMMKSLIDTSKEN